MYIPLYVKTTYSLLSSFVKISELISFCKKNKLDSLAICDNQMFGTMEFINACKKDGINPIIGLEVLLDKKAILLYSKDYNGYQALIKLSTIQSERSVAIEDIMPFLNSVVVVLPFNSSELDQLFPKNIDIYYGYTSKEEERVCYLKNRKVVFLPEILYLNEIDKDLYPYLSMIREGKTLSDNVESLNGIHSPIVEHLERYTDNEGLVNTISIANMCHIEFPEFEILLPVYETEGELSQEEYLFELSKKGLTRRLNGVITREYKERLTYELSVICKMGFANYFLVVYDFILYAKKKGILVGPGRGSGAGSLVAYSLGITEIDPLTYQLLFERFLNPERITMPDIDTDFPDVHRDKVIEYVVSKYGMKQVAGIVTFGTLGAKQALRDVSRALNIPLYKVDTLCKYIPPTAKDKLTDIFIKNEKFKLMIEDDDTLLRAYKIACRIEGFPRHTSSHAAGIVMCKTPLDEVVPLVKSEHMYLTSYSMEYLEPLGLLKMDFLGLKNLTTIMNIMESIKNCEKINIDFNKIPLDDSKALNIFTIANTSGIFQFESVGMRNFLRQLKANSFEDIFAAIALFRPGPAINIDSYIRRKHKEEKITYLDPCLEPILKSTYGIIIYQEQIMQIAALLAGYSLGEADILRRAMSKKKMDLLKSEEEKFVTRSIANGYNAKSSKEIFDMILNFANYGFNRAHSVAYSLIAYKMAYLKAHYPKHFFASLLTGVIGSETKTKEYLAEAKANQLTLLKPDINYSGDHYIVEELGIRYPLSNIKNVGIVACFDILSSRGDVFFTDIFDFLARTTTRSITRKTLESMIDASCFESLGYTHATLFHNIDAILNYADLAKDLAPEYILKPDLEIMEEFSKEELMMREKDIFGFYINNHPSSIYRNDYKNSILLEDVPQYFGKQVEVIGLIETMKVIDTKKGDKMCFISCSDESSSMDFTLFPKVYEQYSILEKGKLIRVIGNVEKRLDRYQIIVKEIILI